jgi:glycosyltransferase involved in cell wall biosynthesis
LARLIAPCPIALRLDPAGPDPLAYQAIQLNRAASMADEFDVIHFHMDFMHFPLFAKVHHKTLTTMHGRLDLPHLPPVFAEFPMMPLVSISSDQRRPLPSANWRANIYHGLPPNLYEPGEHAGGYLAFLGRICPEKRVDRAIEIARRAGIPLRIAAKVDPVDQEYHETCIRPMLNDPLIEYVGEIGEAEKGEFLGQALALLFPIDWPEPFGLVMIEAMACGTPVIAFRKGSVPEVVDDGITGYVVDSVEEAVTAVERATVLDPMAVRARFELKFSARRMAEDYLAAYGDKLWLPESPLFRNRTAFGTDEKSRDAA